MKAVFSNYNFTPNWIKEYDFDYFIYDRSDSKGYLKDFPQDRIKYVENKGTDIYDKFSWIIENYEILPDIVMLSKSNMFKYITKEEFDLVKDNKTFTPLLTKNHKTYSNEHGVVCFYDKQGMFNEINNYYYLFPHPAKFAPILLDIFKMRDRYYNMFSPGSNYILTKEDIRRHPKSLYEKIRACLDWDIYPGDAQICERNLHYLWGTDIIKP